MTTFDAASQNIDVSIEAKTLFKKELGCTKSKKESK
jgi:hypothetical protein